MNGAMFANRVRKGKIRVHFEKNTPWRVKSVPDFITMCSITRNSDASEFISQPARS